MKRQYLIWLMGVIFPLGVQCANSEKAVSCIVRGEIINRPESSQLVLMKMHDDFRTSADIVYIPIQDGKFEYTLHCDYEEMYHLVFYEEIMQGAFTPVPFISESGEINFKLYAQKDKGNNKIEGGILTNEYYQLRENILSFEKPLYEKYNLLNAEGKFYTSEVMDLQKQMDEARRANDETRINAIREKATRLQESDQDITQEAKELREEMIKCREKTNQMEFQFVKDHPTISGYGILVNKIWEKIHYQKGDANPYIDLYHMVYAGKFPDHIYTTEMKTLLCSLENIKVGGKFIDFTTPDSVGNPVQLSGAIRGKVALIHLWASWCGPCRRNGIAMIPVYETYKDKGFTVVGVAREKDSIKAMLDAIQKDGYPWLNLVEMNDKEKIWMKYGIGNSGGGEFLVDENGVILAVNPTAEEVKIILEEKLGKN